MAEGESSQKSELTQFLKAAQDQSKVLADEEAKYKSLIGSGSNMIPKLQISRRYFEKAIHKSSTEADWDLEKAKFGMEKYSLEEARGIDGNDWNLVIHSHLTELNYIDFMERYGVIASEKATNAVKSKGYTKVKLRFYMGDKGNTCLTRRNGDFMGKGWIAINKNMKFPADDATFDEENNYYQEGVRPYVEDYTQ